MLIHRFMLIYHKVLRSRLFTLQVPIISDKEEPTVFSFIGETKPRRVPYVQSLKYK